MKFVFDEWAQMAKQDQEKFEAHRKEIINRLIENCEPSQQHKLRCLQFKLDMERKRSRNPIGACMKMQTLMLDFFYDKFVPNVKTWGITTENILSSESCYKSADIINFSKRNK